MTYCVALGLREGLVFASDTRTNAGVDQIASFRKMTVFEKAGDRVMVLLTSGNLAISQAVVEILRRNLYEEGGLFSVANMFDAASLVGEALRDVYTRDAEHLKRHHAEFSVGMLFGGQIAGENPRIFNVYSAGNFIEACPETPYFQIGETKYGKPILDRVIRHDSTVSEASKCVLISFDSTIRSNISVGAPIDVALYRRDTFRLRQWRVEDNDPYFCLIRQAWGDGLRRVFGEIPNPEW